MNADLPKHLQVGLFAKPSQRYEAWARFSHSVGEQCCASDHVSHHAGLAVKLIDVDGKKVRAPHLARGEAMRERRVCDEST